MKVALIIGVDYYQYGKQLYGCVNDANSVDTVLKRNDGGMINFQTKLLTASSNKTALSRGELKDSIKELFSKDAEIALLYFAGHGHIESSGGYILSSDAKRGDEGVPLSEILKYANESKAKNKIIILDSCHSGIAGASPVSEEYSILAEGVTVLTASTKNQYATEVDGKGVFTTLLIDALTGGAANLTGSVTPGSIYAHIDQSLGDWEQRPIFKTNVKSFVSLRQVTPPIELEDLQKISKLFPCEGYEFKLDPTFEPEMRGRDDDMPSPITKNTNVFKVLQKFNRLNLLVPVDSKHMWNAAMESKACKLTPLGEHYRRLGEKDLL